MDKPKKHETAEEPPMEIRHDMNKQVGEPSSPAPLPPVIGKEAKPLRLSWAEQASNRKEEARETPSPSHTPYPKRDILTLEKLGHFNFALTVLLC
jgi:hypothetical protein